jgi:hypothetical protein
MAACTVYTRAKVDELEFCAFVRDAVAVKYGEAIIGTGLPHGSKEFCDSCNSKLTGYVCPACGAPVLEYRRPGIPIEFSTQPYIEDELLSAVIKATDEYLLEPGVSLDIKSFIKWYEKKRTL